MSNNQNYKEILAYIKLAAFGYVYRGGAWVTICEAMSKYELGELLPNTSAEDEPALEDVPEWMEGFEDLVRSDYDLEHQDYIVLNKLSNEQKVFLQNTCATVSKKTIISTEYLYASWNNQSGYFYGVHCNRDRLGKSKEITFNDLFIPKA